EVTRVNVPSRMLIDAGQSLGKHQPLLHASALLLDRVCQDVARLTVLPANPQHGALTLGARCVRCIGARPFPPASGVSVTPLRPTRLRKELLVLGILVQPPVYLTVKTHEPIELGRRLGAGFVAHAGR